MKTDLRAVSETEQYVHKITHTTYIQYVHKTRHTTYIHYVHKTTQTIVALRLRNTASAAKGPKVYDLTRPPAGGLAFRPRSPLQYVTAEWKPAFLRQAREFLFFPLLPREASK